MNIPHNPLKISKDDILVSKVRTYRKGIAYINKDYEELICSPAFLVIREVNESITKEYLYSVLRHDFFIEQILSLQNRGMYPRLDGTTKEEVFIPIPKDEDVIKYITLLTRAIIDKEEEIRTKFKKINQLIEKELKDQKLNLFVYTFPSFAEVKENERIDTGIYSSEYKKILHLIENATNGYYYIPEDKFKSGSTPKKRMIGRGDKNWIVPTHVSRFGYLSKKEKIICDKTNIKKDCVLIINRTSKGGLGEYVGISTFYDFSKNGKAQHNQGFYRIEDYPKEELKLIAIILNCNYYRRLCGYVSLGSKMKEIKTKNFAKIPLPKFEGKIKKELLSLYSQEKKYSNNMSLTNFQEIDKQITKESGILELANQIERIQNRLHIIIDNLVNDNKIDLKFEFLDVKSIIQVR